MCFPEQLIQCSQDEPGDFARVHREQDAIPSHLTEDTYAWRKHLRLYL